MYPWIARNLIYYPVQFLRGEKVNKYRDELRAFNRLSVEHMKEKQWEKMTALLKYVYKNNPYYKKLFDDNNLTPERIQNPDDFKKIPYLNKAVIQTNHKQLLSTGSRRLDHRKTSGSSGMPLQFVKDRIALACMNAVMHEVYGWHGIEIGDRSCRIWAIPREFKRQWSIFIRDLLQNRIRLNSFDVSDESSIKFYHAIRKFKPKFMMGVPSYMTDFSKRLIKAGLNPADMGLKTLITTGEILYPAQKELLQEHFRCTIANEYGTTECGIVAFACRHDKMHVQNYNLYVEVINPETGRDACPGEPGEIVLTELHSYAMPFIRYRLGDTVVLSDELCSCGMESPLFAHIEGRLEDMIETPDGRKVAGGMLYYTLTRGIHQFKAYQRAVNKLEVFIEKGPDFSEKFLEDVIVKWREYLGEEMQFEFKFVDRVPADPSGKLRYFVPEFDPEYTKDGPLKK
ncbi:MAG: phenylacetate--CoA ligase family protein [Candidatus Zixiibacteriota bacterium]